MTYLNIIFFQSQCSFLSRMGCTFLLLFQVYFGDLGQALNWSCSNMALFHGARHTANWQRPRSSDFSLKSWNDFLRPVALMGFQISFHYVGDPSLRNVSISFMGKAWREVTEFLVIPQSAFSLGSEHFTQTLLIPSCLFMAKSDNISSVNAMR